jgi:hypothetical protein
MDDPSLSAFPISCDAVVKSIINFVQPLCGATQPHTAPDGRTAAAGALGLAGERAPEALAQKCV